MADEIRTNLVTHLHCCECGAELRLATERPAGLVAQESTRYDTGAACLTNKVWVYPCRNCIDIKTGPALQLTEAIRFMAMQAKG